MKKPEVGQFFRIKKPSGFRNLKDGDVLSAIQWHHGGVGKSEKVNQICDVHVLEEETQSFRQQTESLIQKIDMSKFPNKYYFDDYIEGICKEAVWSHTPGQPSTYTYNEVTVKIDANGKMSLEIEIKQTLTVD